MKKKKKEWTCGDRAVILGKKSDKKGDSADARERGGSWDCRGPEVPNEGHVWNRPQKAGPVWNREETGQEVDQYVEITGQESENQGFRL